MNYRQYVDRATADRIYQVFNGVYKTSTSVKGFEYHIVPKTGAGKDVDASVSLIRDPEGKPTGFRGLVRDITEKKRMEAQIFESQKMEQRLFWREESPTSSTMP